MAVQFTSRTVTVPLGTGNQQIIGGATFGGGNVQSADTAIKGYFLDYGNGDHAMNRIQVSTSVIEISGPFVRFIVVCQYNDQGNDDPYTGIIEVLILADVA